MPRLPIWLERDNAIGDQPNDASTAATCPQCGMLVAYHECELDELNGEACVIVNCSACGHQAVIFLKE